MQFFGMKRKGKWPRCDDFFWEVWRIDNLSVQMEAYFFPGYLEWLWRRLSGIRVSKNHNFDGFENLLFLEGDDQTCKVPESFWNFC